MTLSRVLMTQACVVLTLAGTTVAQNDTKGDDDVLRGPRVRQQRAPGTERPFATDSRRQDARPMALIGAIRSLNAEDAPESVRLTEEQMVQIREIFSVMRDAANDQPPQASRNAPQRQRAEGRPDRDSPPSRANQPRSRDNADNRPGRPDQARSRDSDAPSRTNPPQARDDMRSRDAAPQPEQARIDRQRLMADAGTRIWSVLSEEQRAYVESNMGPQAERQPDMMSPRDAPRRESPAWLNEMPPSLRDRLNDMSPEARQALWARLDRALSQRGDAPADRRTPPMERVRVPEPDRR